MNVIYLRQINLFMNFAGRIKETIKKY